LAPKNHHKNLNNLDQSSLNFQYKIVVSNILKDQLDIQQEYFGHFEQHNK